MARIIMKFGGTSVSDVDHIANVAKSVKLECDSGNQIAVVVSAMAGMTDQLVNHVNSISTKFDGKEYDTVVTAGEQITCGLLALALQEAGISARSFLGWQIPIKTDDVFGKARIKNIDTKELEKCLAAGTVTVVPGFQGVTTDSRITSLGRGGSDTSAVALAAALRADRCDIYTDVNGVYTTDPRIVPLARKLDYVTYEEMLEMASLGAKVLQPRSVELAMKQNVRIQVRSSYHVNQNGTLVVDEEEVLEQELVRGIAYSRDEAKITLVGLENRPGIAASIFGPLADAGINVDMIVQNVSANNKHADLTFTVAKSDLTNAINTLETWRAENKLEDIFQDSAVCKVSVVGVGMRSHAGVAQKMFRTLADKGINIEVISTSEIKVSVLIADEYTELAVRALHTAYDLDGDADLP
ncbi:MAG: Aspartate kinase Ask_LysC [Alphaproteobacteria bacterium MarineAlpha3_Bin5]|nr:MAG: Aspartate kinase Ask_LysC [Alphaproteobacteria bacterium MarineAlpha3_Bin5]